MSQIEGKGRLLTDLHGCVLKSALVARSNHLVYTPLRESDFKELERFHAMGNLGDPTSQILLVPLDKIPSRQLSKAAQDTIINPEKNKRLSSLERISQSLKYLQGYVNGLALHHTNDEAREGLMLLSRHGIKCTIVSNMPSPYEDALRKKMVREGIWGSLDPQFPAILRRSRNIHTVLTKLIAIEMFNIGENRYPLIVEDDFYIAQWIAACFPTTVYMTIAEKEAESQIEKTKLKLPNNLRYHPKGDIVFDSGYLHIAKEVVASRPDFTLKMLARADFK